MIELNQKTRKELRKLKAKAYAHELDQHLLKLSCSFDDWKNKKIDCWTLSDLIHDFHEGISRDLYNAYNARSVDEVYMVSRAFAIGLLQKEEIPSEALETVERCAATFFKKNETVEPGD